MKTIMDNYGVLNDKEPDEVKLTVKVIDWWLKDKKEKNQKKKKKVVVVNNNIV
jgi:hypothetical protein